VYGIAAFKMQVDGQHTEILVPILFLLCFQVFANIAYPFLAGRCQNRRGKQVN
jgi:hypothetical protein